MKSHFFRFQFKDIWEDPEELQGKDACFIKTRVMSFSFSEFLKAMDALQACCLEVNGVTST